MGIIVPTGKSGIFGNLKQHGRARAALPILVLRAQEPNTITFRELGNAIGFRRYDLFGGILDCINTELHNINADIPTLSTIVVRINNDGKMEPSGWMANQMQEQLNIEPTWENYHRICIQPVFDYPDWDKVMDEIIQSPNW
ncbi:hypothetical protein F4212_06630 [Candidatus Poribacteria bacterium]|nr:hypothetical protein [Candidatus Poribacteria bacterium]